MSGYRSSASLRYSATNDFGVPSAPAGPGFGATRESEDDPESPIARILGRANPPPREEQEGYLQSLRLPPGISREILNSCETFPLRIWIIDNSGSMAQGDGHKVVRGPGGRQGLVSCSRWEELGDALEWHAGVAASLRAPTEFRLLNAVGGAGNRASLNLPGGGAVIRCGFGDPGEIDAMRTLVRSQPQGRTPLCEQIRNVIARVREVEPALRAAGQRCVVVIASDGQATDGDLAAVMQPLRDLPVWVVVRLCTDEDEVVEYWNNVDEELELDMDVLDDLSGEAGEIAAVNPWVTYGAALHRLREWGTPAKILDLIDEKAFSAAEMHQMIGLIFGPGLAEELPHPDFDWPGFEKGLRELVAQHPEVWCPIRKRDKPWFSVNKIRRKYHGRGCVIQ